MKKIKLDKYGPIISNKVIGDEIYKSIKHVIIEEGGSMEVDLSGIKSMATFNAKQIFGRLYIELGAHSFFEKVRLVNASEDVKLIIKIGIQNAIEDNVGD